MAEISWRNWANIIGYGINAAITFGSSFGLFGPDNTTLAAKYQTLLTPAGTAFSIWGFIFMGEAVFAVAQMLPKFRNSKLIELVTPGWLTACFFQASWSIVFAQEWVVLSFFLILGILAGLLMIALVTDGVAVTWGEYLVLRLPFSLHLGWVIAASVLNVSVMSDYNRLSPPRLLEIAVTSVGILCISTTWFSLVMKSADPTVCFVAAWAFNWISVEIWENQSKLDNPDRHNPYTWDRVTLQGLQGATANAAVLALLLGVVAIARASWTIWGKDSSSAPKVVDHTQELVDGTAAGA